MSPERHHWKPAVQAAAVMLRTSPVDGQSLASEPRPLAIYGAQCWERLRHPPVTNQQRAHTKRKLGFALCCHSNTTRAPIANPPNSAQLGGSLYHASKLHPGLCSNVGVRPRTDTQTRVTTIHFASSTTHAKSNQGRWLTECHPFLSINWPKGWDAALFMPVLSNYLLRL